MPFKIYKKYVMLLAFTAPALIFYAIFLLIPTISGMYYSFTDWNGLNPNYSFIGLGNFVESLKEDPDFLNSLWFTLKYVLVMIVLQNVLALALAVLIESRTRTKGFFRTIFFMPNMISTIISAFMWTFVFLPCCHRSPKRRLSHFWANRGWAIRKYLSSQLLSCRSGMVSVI